MTPKTKATSLRREGLTGGESGVAERGPAGDWDYPRESFGLRSYFLIHRNLDPGGPRGVFSLPDRSFLGVAVPALTSIESDVSRGNWCTTD